MQKYCSIKMKILLFGAIFLVFALMVSSATAAAIKGGFAVSGRTSSKVAEEPGSGEPVKENLDASVTAAEPGSGEPIKDIDISLEEFPGGVTAAVPGSGEPIKEIDEIDLSLEYTSTDEILDWDKFFAELEALFEELLAENAIATKAESSALTGIDKVGIHTRKPEPAGDVPVDFIGAAFGDQEQSVLGRDIGKSSIADNRKALDAFIGATTKSLKKGERVALVGFGSFSATKRSARTGRDSQTGKTVKFPAKKTVGFKAGAALKSRL